VNETRIQLWPVSLFPLLFLLKKKKKKKEVVGYSEDEQCKKIKVVELVKS